LLAFLQQSSPSNSDKPHVLDLGCGNGSLSYVINQAGYEVTGIEASASGIQLAKTQYHLCRFIEASIYDLPYENLASQFDVVVSAEVIEHLLYPRELLRAAKRCLKPGGQLILTTPYHGYWKNLALALAGKMDQHFMVLKDGGHVKFFSRNTLEQLMKQEGFSQVQFKFAGRYPYLWKSMICKGVLEEEGDFPIAE
jgi:2-polyprenyl-3-methyl-5-hydroxy-6-metoxy-1,4-benzoquinol methylase